MGTSGAALFADDSACDVRDEFIERLRAGQDAAEATRAIVQCHGELLADVDEGPVFWLALAATQWKYGCLVDEVRARAIEVIDSGADLARWTGAAAARRRTVLDGLREQLHSPQPKYRRPRRRPQIVIPSVTVPSPDGRASAVAYALNAHPGPAEPRTQVYVEMSSNGSRGGGHVALADCRYDEIALVWLDPDTLQVGHPASAVLSNAHSTFYYCGRLIAIQYKVVDAGR